MYSVKGKEEIKHLHLFNSRIEIASIPKYPLA